MPGLCIGAGRIETSPPATAIWARADPSGRATRKYSREPSVTMRFTGLLPSVSCLVPVTRGNCAEEKNQIKAVATRRTASTAAAHIHTRLLLRKEVGEVTTDVAAVTLPEVVSRFRRFRSERNSA